MFSTAFVCTQTLLLLGVSKYFFINIISMQPVLAASALYHSSSTQGFSAVSTKETEPTETTLGHFANSGWQV